MAQLINSAVLKSGLRRWARQAWIHLLDVVGGLERAEDKIRTGSGIVVLTFHRVLPSTDFSLTPSPRGMVLSETTFESILKFLKEQTEPYDLAAFRPDWTGSFSRPRVAVTFDDGWKDTAEIAAPLLRKYRIPAAVFVCPGLVGRASPFWPEVVVTAWRRSAKDERASAQFAAHCRTFFPGMDFGPTAATTAGLEDLITSVKSLSATARTDFVGGLAQIGPDLASSENSLHFEATASWDQLRDMRQAGIEIGSHTVHHEILPLLPTHRARSEVVESKSTIELELGHSCSVFAYPNGDCSQEVREIVVDAGYELAFVNRPGVWDQATDRWQIPRINIWEGTVTGTNGKFSASAFRYAVYRKALKAFPK